MRFVLTPVIFGMLLERSLSFQNKQQSFIPSPGHISMTHESRNRRVLLGASSIFGGFFGGNNDPEALAAAANPKSAGPTNAVIKTVNGMNQRRLGGSDIIVSDLGLGTQRWVSDDFNAPNEKTCYDFLDLAILKHGVNLLDTAEQYPIPSGGASAREGDSERLIGKWLNDRKGSVKRENVVIATKITGGKNITPKNIKQVGTSIYIWSKGVCLCPILFGIVSEQLILIYMH